MNRDSEGRSGRTLTGLTSDQENSTAVKRRRGKGRLCVSTNPCWCLLKGHGKLSGKPANLYLTNGIPIVGKSLNGTVGFLALVVRLDC